MKTQFPKNLTATLFAGAAFILLSQRNLSAATWTNFAGDAQWTTAANWSPNAFPDANGAVADFQVDVPVNYNVGVSSGNPGRRVSTLKLGDTNGTQNLTIDTGGASTSRLTFTNSTGSGLLEKRGNGNDSILVGRMQVSVTNLNITFTGGTGTLTINCNNASIQEFAGFTPRVTISGAGTLILLNQNQHTGGTFISGSTVQIDADNRLGGSSGGVTIGNNATLRVNANVTVAAGRSIVLKGGGSAYFTTVTNSQTMTVAGPISSDIGSPSSFVAAGPGTVSLTGANTYAGPTLLSGGTLSLLAANYSGGGGLSVSNGATLTIDASGNGQLNVSNVALGDGGEVTLNFKHGSVAGVNPSNPALNVTGAFNPAATNIKVSVTGSGFVVGQYPLIDYTGAPLASITNFSLTSLPPGIFANLSNNTANTSIDLVITLSVNALTWFGSVDNNWDINTTTNWHDPSLLPIAYKEYGSAGDIVLFDDSLDGTSLRTNINLTTAVHPSILSVTNNSYDYSLAGPGKITGVTILNKGGANSLTLGTANDFTGGSSLYQGKVWLGDNLALGSGPVTLAGSALSSSSGAARTITNSLSLTLANNLFTTLGDAVNNGTLTFSGPVNFGDAARDIICSNDVVFTGPHSSGGWDQKRGMGTLRLEGITGDMANGQFQLEEGMWIVSGGNFSKSGGGIRIWCTPVNSTSYLVISNGAVITVTATGSNLRLGASGSSEPSSTNIVDLAGTITWTTNNDNSTGGKVQMGAACSLAQLNLKAGGLLRPYTFLNEGPATEINLDGGTLAPLTDNSTFMQGMAAAFIRSGGVVIDTEGKDITIAQPLLDGGGGGVLTKNGLGKITLTGTNTYTGNTAVNGGTLVVTPAHAGTGTITIASGAAGGFLSTGAGITVSVPAVNVSSGGSLEAEFGGQLGNPGVAAGAVASLTLNGTVTVNAAAGGLSPGTVPLISYTTLLGGGSVATGQLPLGVAGFVTNNTAAKVIQLVVSSVTPVFWTGSSNSSWDIGITTNWTLNGTPLAYQEGASVRMVDSASTSLVVVQEPVNPASVLVSNSALPYTITTAGSGKLTGITGITKDGTNTLIVSGSHDFDGTVTVKNGLFLANSTGALGSSNGVTIVETNAVLDAGGKDLKTERVFISGPGLNSGGVLISSVANQNCFRFVTMTGDAFIGAVNGVQWGFQDPIGPGSGATNLNGNGFKLTKVGSGDFLLKDLGETYLGDIDIMQSALSFQFSTSMGDPLKTCTVYSNGIFALRSRTTLADKVVVMYGGSMMRNNEAGVSADFAGPITLNDTCQFFVTFGLNLLGPVGGSGTLLKTDPGVLVLSATNTYGGSTIITNGTVQLASTGLLNGTTNIFVNTAATFDPSPAGTFTLLAGRTLAGGGTVVGNMVANGVVTPGASIGTLSFTSDLTLAGTTIMEVTKDGGLTNDVINVTGALTTGGTLQVLLSGATPLAVNDTFDLFNWGTNSGSFSSIVLPSGYTWDTSQLGVNGTIRVTAVAAPLSFVTPQISGNNLVLSGSGGAPGGPYRLLMHTNVTVPLTNWTPILTNNFDGSGNFSITLTNALGSGIPRQFFALRVQ